jgi:hypothetical protein
MQILTNTMTSAAGPVIQQQAGLDTTYERLRNGRLAHGLDELLEALRARCEEEPETWPEYARACLNHPVCRLLHQDPFTYRAFSKPRGYAGDAVMMDYIYGLGEAGQAIAAATPLGRAIFQYLDTRSPAKAGVRHRRRLLGSLIDRVAKRGGSRVLAIAAGHVREVELSDAVQTRKLEEFVALDQDEASLAVVARDYAHLGIRTVNGSVRQILAGKLNPGEFDLVYAAGLFDYLNAPVAAALTRRMFDMTRPGGMMLIPNFLASVRDRGYMESFMDWHLIYRDHADMEELAAALPQSSVADCQIFDGDEGAITYLLASKAS